MKNLTSKLLLAAIVIVHTGSMFSMEKTLGSQRATEAMVKLYNIGKPEDFEAAKKIISTIPRADINAIDSFAGGNLLDLATARFTQLHDQRYKEIMDLLVSKGAARSQGTGGFIPPQED